MGTVIEIPCSMTLKDKAGLVGAATALGLGKERGPGGAFENLTDTLASLGRALEVVPGLDMTSNLSSLVAWEKNIDLLEKAKQTEDITIEKQAPLVGLTRSGLTGA